MVDFHLFLLELVELMLQIFHFFDKLLLLLFGDVCKMINFFIKFFLLSGQSKLQLFENTCQVFNFLILWIDHIIIIIRFVSQIFLYECSFFLGNFKFFLKVFNLLPMFRLILLNHFIILSLRSIFFSEIIVFHFLSLSFISDSELNNTLFVLLLSFSVLGLILLLNVLDLWFEIENFLFE